jgi:ABC-type glycerol-3-phosphate transport system substrate-binding protein
MASLRRRRTMQLLFAAVAVLVLSAVAVTSAGAGKRDQVTLEIWSPENRAEDGQAHAWLIQQFQKENPGIDVKYTITSWDDHFNKIQAAAAAHNLPDIMYSWQPNTLSVQQQGLITDITDVWNQVGLSKFPPAQVQDLRTGTKFYSIPFFGVPHAFWYRKDWFAEAHISPPTTWDGIVQAAKKLTGKGRYGICLFNKDLDAYYIIDHMIAAGAEPFDSKGNIAINTPGTVRVLQFIKTINDQKLTAPGWTAWNMDDAKLPFLAGKCGMKIDSTSFLNAVVNNNPELVDKIGLFPIPLDGGKFAGLAGASSYTISAQTKHPAEAKKFLEFLFRPDVYTNFMAREVLGFIPVNSKVALGNGLYRSPRISKFASVYKAAYVAMNRGRPGIPVYAKTAVAAAKVYNQTVYSEMGARIYKGEDPKAVAAWAAKRIKEIASTG